MDGENNGEPYFLMDDFGGTPVPLIFGNIHIVFHLDFYVYVILSMYGLLLGVTHSTGKLLRGARREGRDDEIC